MGVAARQYYMHHFWPLLERFHDRLGREHLVADRVVDLVEDDHVVPATKNLSAGKLPCVLDHPDVLRIGFLGPNLYEPATHGKDLQVVVTQHLGRVQLAIMPRALNELYH